MVYLSTYGDCGLIMNDGPRGDVIDEDSNARFHFFYNERKTWSEARDSCTSFGAGGRLLVINSKEAHKAVRRLINSNKKLKNPKGKGYWIGANDVDNEGKFTFTDGTELTYQDGWYKAPNNNVAKSSSGQDCVRLWEKPNNKPKWQFDDAVCTDKSSYICEDPSQAVLPIAATVLPSKATEGPPSLYRIDYTKRSFLNAARACSDNGMKLVEIRSVQERESVEDAIRSTGEEMYSSIPGLWTGMMGMSKHVYISDETFVDEDVMYFQDGERNGGGRKVIVAIDTTEPTGTNELFQWYHESMSAELGSICQLLPDYYSY